MGASCCTPEGALLASRSQLMLVRSVAPGRRESHQVTCQLRGRRPLLAQALQKRWATGRVAPGADEREQAWHWPAAAGSRLLRFVRTGSGVGVDEGGCSPTRAGARCACRLSRIRPAASTPVTPAIAAKQGHGPVAHDASLLGDVVGCASGREARLLPSRMARPAFPFARVFAADLGASLRATPG
jgi:hypothetical protein